MNRPIVYPGQIPLSSDLLNLSRHAMVGLSKLAAAILGTNTIVNGLPCTAVAGAMQVSIGAGEIYQLGQIDTTQYGSLQPETQHQILKQGVALDPTTLSIAAPASPNQSVCYLVQATFQEVDSDLTVLPFYNASNPTVAFIGQANNGQALPTTRKGSCVLSLKSGTVATAPSLPVVPTPDPGYVGLWVITVSYGQTAITASNIAAYTPSPLLLENLTQKISAATGDLRYATYAAVAAAQATATSAITPAGAVTFFAQSTAPSGWLVANGGQYSTSLTQLQALYNAIGTTYNHAGDAAGTFRVPDLRGEFVRGWDAGAGIDPGRAFGSLQLDQFQDHQHNSLIYQTWYAQSGSATPCWYGGSWTPTSYAINGNRGSETRPRNLALLPCIKY